MYYTVYIHKLVKGDYDDHDEGGIYMSYSTHTCGYQRLWEDGERAFSTTA